MMERTSSSSGTLGSKQPLTSSTVVTGQLYDRSISCDAEQHNQSQTGQSKQPQHSKSFLHNHLTSNANSSLQWKSAEDIFMSSRGAKMSAAPSGEASEVEGLDNNQVAAEVSNNGHRLVNSVSAYPLANTTTNTNSAAVSQSMSSATPAVSTSTIASTSSSSSSSAASTTSSAHVNAQLPLSSSCLAMSDSHTNTSHTNTGLGFSHNTDTVASHSTSTPVCEGEPTFARCNSVGGVAPLDLSGIPPLTQVTLPTPTENGEGRFSHSPAPSPNPSPTLRNRQTSCDSSDDKLIRNDSYSFMSREGSVEPSFVEISDNQLGEKLLDSVSRSSESSRSVEAPRTPEIGGSINGVVIKERERKESRDSKSSDKKSNKAWYKMLNPTYKSRSEDLKRLFKDLPSDERLIVDYSCALQKDILVHGRLYVTPNYFSFYSKIFGWETFVSIKCKDIIAMTKEKTALVIPNAIEVRTEGEKHFFTSFASRDKTYLMLFRIWQNALMDQQMSATELWQWVHSSYGDELGLTSDDDDYVAPSTEDDSKTNLHSNFDSSTYSTSGNPKLYSIDSLDETGPGEQSAGESQPNNLSKNGGGDSETSEMGGPPKPHLPKTPSPAKLLPHHGPPHASSSQANDGIPTDMSDSTDTEPDSKVTCLGTGESVVCPNITTHHQGREIINTVYALPVDTVFTLLFTNSKFMLDLYTARKTSDVVASPWQSNPETNQKIRQVTYTLTLPPNNFGPKVSHVTETQVVSPFSKHGDIYTVDAEACNAGIPYADSFFVSNHWCLTRESATETRISVWSQVKYKKNVWGFMKGVIDKNAYCGVESLLNDINAALLAEVDLSNLKRTRRRRRRVGSKGEPPDVLLASTVDKVKDIHKATQIPQRKLITPDNGMSSNEGPVRVVVATLVVLLTLNALLYYKLWALEEKVVLHGSPYPSFDPKLFRSGSFSGPLEEWIRILQHQEALHAAEVERWRKSIEEAAGFLRKAEESLRNLHTSIPPQHASKIQFLLRQIQNLHEAESQRRSSEGRETDSPPVVQKRSEGVEELTSDSVYRNSKVNEVNLEL
ncbi:protein Aster-B-like isoform X2 [Palaemon carinicauda]|uniref:protein Aster-B-like isoform X2 n=1 Tax=Palaemon carinicauda TaxID=392227 RepID=UPI0035B590E7